MSKGKKDAHRAPVSGCASHLAGGGYSLMRVHAGARERVCFSSYQKQKTSNLLAKNPKRPMLTPNSLTHSSSHGASVGAADLLGPTLRSVCASNPTACDPAASPPAAPASAPPCLPGPAGEASGPPRRASRVSVSPSSFFFPREDHYTTHMDARSVPPNYGVECCLCSGP